MLPIRRKNLWRLAVAVGGVLIGLAVSEIIARFVSPADDACMVFNSPDAEPRGLFSAEPSIGMVLTPNFQGQFRTPGHSVLLRVNSLGMRGPEPTSPKTGYRWLTIGDSFALSLQVPEEETFEALLARGLGAEVLNGGVSGDSTWQSVARYRRWADSLQPDAVLLLFFVGNDITDDGAFDRARLRGGGHAPPPGASPPGGPGAPQPGPGPAPTGPGASMDGSADLPPVGPDGAPPAGRVLRVLPVVSRWLLQRSYLWSHIRVAMERRAVAAGTPLRVAQWKDELAIYTRAGRPLLTSLAPVTRDALAELQREAGARGDRLVVALAPPLFAVDQERLPATFDLVGLDPADADLDAPTALVQGILDALGIASCDLTPALRAAHDAGVETYLAYDAHWSPAGHAVVAEALRGCIAGDAGS
ncbi:MAG: hypothetical protein ABIO70_22740 [Pseudomonadota bacterium]